MATPIRVPRLNNNDDAVRVTRLIVGRGEAVRAGNPVAEVVTDKATFVVDADRDGHVIAVCVEEGQVVDVGAVIAWLGEAPDDPAPLGDAASPIGQSGLPTLRARALLTEYGIDAASVPASGARLSAADVETYIARRHETPDRPASPTTHRSDPDEARPQAAGTAEPLSPEARAMVRRVSWHRSQAVPGYVEIHYESAPWQQCAESFQEAQHLLLPPLLALMAWKLVQVVKARPHLNATIVDQQRYVYDHINLGFTVQSQAALYLVVLQDAEALPARAFCNRITELQRSAMGDALSGSQVSGATIAFSSMARWNVVRHIPVLPPHTSLVVAHSAVTGAQAALGATYDHRIVNGAEVGTLLTELGRPPDRQALDGTP